MTMEWKESPSSLATGIAGRWLHVYMDEGSWWMDYAPMGPDRLQKLKAPTLGPARMEALRIVRDYLLKSADRLTAALGEKTFPDIVLTGLDHVTATTPNGEAMLEALQIMAVRRGAKSEDYEREFGYTKRLSEEGI